MSSATLAAAPERAQHVRPDIVDCYPRTSHDVFHELTPRLFKCRRDYIAIRSEAHAVPARRLARQLDAVPNGLVIALRQVRPEKTRSSSSCSRYVAVVLRHDLSTGATLGGNQPQGLINALMPTANGRALRNRLERDERVHTSLCVADGHTGSTVGGSSAGPGNEPFLQPVLRFRTSRAANG
jgi:hypothetical protein